MEYSDQALVLRVGRHREHDCWMRGYSPRHGLFTAFAFGGLRSRRRFCGCLDALNLLSLRCRREKGGRYVSLQETSLIHAPRRLRQDWGRLGILVNCLKFMETLSPGAEHAASAFTLARQTVEVLDTVAVAPRIYPSLFRWRLTLDQGWHLDADRCGCCGSGWDAMPRGSRVLFAPRVGEMRCAACGREPDAPAGMWLEAGAVRLLHAAATQPPADWLAPDAASLAWPGAWPDAGPGAGRDGWRDAARAADAHVLTHTGIHWDKFGYRRP